MTNVIFRRCVSIGGNGFRIIGMDGAVDNCQAISSRGDGFTAAASDNRVTDLLGLPRETNHLELAALLKKVYDAPAEDRNVIIRDSAIIRDLKDDKNANALAEAICNLCNSRSFELAMKILQANGKSASF